MIRARAIENQCYIIAAAQVGYHNEKRRSYGHAMIVDPWGKILAECDNDLPVPQCKIAKIDLGPLENIKNRLPCFEHRRDDVYSLVPIRMISPERSILGKCADSESVPIQDEKTPYFMFEKYPVPKSTTFLDTQLSVAFTNITCVVPGRKYYFYAID